MKTQTAKRQSNIELLRMLSMLGVIILHYNNKSVGRGLQFVLPYSVNCHILMILESTAICAVDLFMLISGYFSYGSTTDIGMYGSRVSLAQS